MKHNFSPQIRVWLKYFEVILLFPTLFVTLYASEVEGFVGPSYVTRCSNEVRIEDFGYLQDCLKDLVEEPSSYNICSDVVETPISTRPALFANYQAKRAARFLFAGVNKVFREIQLDDLVRSREKRFKEGLARSSQFPKEYGEEGEVLDGVIKLPDLKIPSQMLYLHVPFVPRTQVFCKVMASDDGVSCQQAPIHTPESFYFFAICKKGVANFNANVFIYSLAKQVSPFDASFPSVSPLGTQTIHEVALPPPQFESIW